MDKVANTSFDYRIKANDALSSCEDFAKDIIFEVPETVKEAKEAIKVTVTRVALLLFGLWAMKQSNEAFDKELQFMPDTTRLAKIVRNISACHKPGEALFFDRHKIAEALTILKIKQMIIANKRDGMLLASMMSLYGAFFLRR